MVCLQLHAETFGEKSFTVPAHVQCSTYPGVDGGGVDGEDEFVVWRWQGKDSSSLQSLFTKPEMLM